MDFFFNIFESLFGRKLVMVGLNSAIRRYFLNVAIEKFKEKCAKK